MIDTTILIKLDGTVELLENIDFQDIMKDKEMGAPISKQGYKLAVAVKLFQYMDDSEERLNRKATDLFSLGDLYGNVYLFLDPENTKEETYQKYKCLYDDITTNTYVKYTSIDKMKDSRKVQKLLKNMKRRGFFRD